MEAQTSLAMGIAAMRGRYDATCKRVLSEKQILSRIMRDYLDEYRDVPLSRIEEECIEGTPRVGTDPVDRDSFATRVRGSNMTDETVGEGAVFFDVRFEAIVPGSGERVRIEIDVEAQNRADMPYPLLRRAVYYCGRMLSQQGAAEVVNSHYERVRKVFSIWICSDAPKAYRGSVSRFRMRKEDVIGSAPFEKCDYDLVEVIVICPPGGDGGEPGGALDMLGVLFDTNREPVDKMRILQNEYGMMMTEQIQEGVSAMCNLSEGIYMKGIEKGIEQGIEQGKEEMKLTVAQRLVEELGLTSDQAMSFLEISEDQRLTLMERLQEA